MRKKILIVSTQARGCYEDYFVRSFNKLDFEAQFVNTSVLAKWPKKVNQFIAYIIKYNFYKRKATNYILKKTNIEFFQLFEKMKPDLVFIYNDSNLLPETIDKIKNSGSKVILLLADNPMWINYRWWFALDVLIANLVLVHDKEWMPWMKMLGQNNVNHIIGGGNDEVFYPLNTDDNGEKLYESDILFVGRNYGLNSEAIYRGKILNSLVEYNLKIYGNIEWLPVFKFYPMLKEKFILKSLTSDELNIARNSTKIYLALANSGLPSGVHLRIFDAALSGTFIITEYRRGIEEIFPEGMLETFESINDLKEKVDYYLGHEEERKQKALLLRNYVLKNYTIDRLTERIGSLMNSSINLIKE